MKIKPILATMLAAIATPIAAQPAAAPAAMPLSQQAPPKLIVVISVDQFSADLFAEYRQRFTSGFTRLTDGVVFPSAYQSHAATETCPGHSTIMTGNRPEHTGIIANTWVDFADGRPDKQVYCAEDEHAPGSSTQDYTVSPMHLRVPTLGERMKALDPRTRTVSVSGKDRAAVMMGGHVMDEIWWYKGGRFVSYAGRQAPSAVERTNAAMAKAIATAEPPLEEPDVCRRRDRAIPIGDGKSVGTGRFGHAAGDAKAFQYSPQMDGATLALAAALVGDMRLGRGAAPDVLTIGLSATDFIGHTYGTEGSEMCLNLLSLDRDLGDFFATLDRMGVDYAVVLTADHGGHDLPERQRMHGVTGDQRVAPAQSAHALSQAIAKAHGIRGPSFDMQDGQLVAGTGAPDAFVIEDGDLYLTPGQTPAQRQAVMADARAALMRDPQIEAVLTRADILAAPPVTGRPPETWSLAQRARASFDPARSGDLLIFLKPRVVAVADPTKGYVTTHGSPWDYDRRVPLLFWRRGMAGFEQPLSVETVDIMPSLAGLMHVPLPATGVDGHCLDLDPGPGSTCPAG